MGSKEPLVSIGMPVYNGASYIREALDSLLLQDYRNLEIIISDNASRDETQAICLEYAKRDKRIHYWRSDINRGAAWNFTNVFELASGGYFMWAAYDDYWSNSYVSSCLQALFSSERIILSGSMCDSVDRKTGKSLYVDPGVSTVGLTAPARFIAYMSALHRDGHIGGIFYGIYKRQILQRVMPMKKVFANDHLVPAELCFHGEFFTVPKRLMFKRQGGVSRNYKSNARTQGARNMLFIHFPYFSREIFLQRIIFKTDRLKLLERVRLSFWSANNYARFCARRTRRFFSNRPPLVFIKGPIMRFIKLWRITRCA
jgi:glycosyltransferase involved in cell wall biosynthesis